MGSAESSEPKPVARPMTRTPTVMMSNPAIRARLDWRLAGAGLRPEGRLDPCRAGRERRNAPRPTGLVPAEPAWPTGPLGLEGPLGLKEPLELERSVGSAGRGPAGPVEPTGPGPVGPAGRGPAGPVEPTGPGPVEPAGRGPAGPVEPAGLAGSAGPAGRGPGTAEPRGRAWPPRSLELQDTIRLPVTFAVLVRGLFPWLHHVVLGPAVYRRSVCPGPGLARP